MYLFKKVDSCQEVALLFRCRRMMINILQWLMSSFFFQLFITFVLFQQLSPSPHFLYLYPYLHLCLLPISFPLSVCLISPRPPSHPFPDYFYILLHFRLFHFSVHREGATSLAMRPTASLFEFHVENRHQCLTTQQVDTADRLFLES